MRIEGMSTVRRVVARLVAVATLAGGLTMERPALAESWKPALHDADDLHEAAEDLHDRAHRLHDANVVPLAAALEEVTESLYQGLKHQDCVAEIVPLLNQAEELLNQTSASVALSCEMRTDRKAVAQLEDARRHFLAVAERVNCTLREHAATSPARFPQSTPAWSAPAYGTQYSQAPAWIEQPSAPGTWGNAYRAPAQDYGTPHHQHCDAEPYYYQSSYYQPSMQAPAPTRKLPRVLISGVLTH